MDSFLYLSLFTEQAAICPLSQFLIIQFFPESNFVPLIAIIALKAHVSCCFLRNVVSATSEVEL